MKAILMSIRPRWVAKILNGEKTIEIRKTAPREWARYLNGKGPKPEPCEVYIYCTQDKNNGLYWVNEYVCISQKGGIVPSAMNGKVVAKFTLNKVERFINGLSSLEREYCYVDNEFDYQAYENVLDKACLTYEEAEEYTPDQSFYAWYISDLVIFTTWPKELSEFYVFPKKETPAVNGLLRVREIDFWGTGKEIKSLAKAPQSWCYVEELE